MQIYVIIAYIKFACKRRVNIAAANLQVIVKIDLTDGYNIVNRADVGGQYLNEWQAATAQWLTVVFRPADTTPLPKTGY